MRFGPDPIPGSIVMAICKVQSSLGAVSKSQKNQHGGYMFSSTDDIYAEVMRKMAAAGLVVLPCEREAEIVRIEKDGKTAQWLRVVFGFMLATSEASWTDETAKRTLYIQITGPQTFQAAQSYAEKAYLRSLFKLPTGDMDLDSVAQADSEEDMLALSTPQKRKSSNSAKKDGTDRIFNEIRKAIAESINPEMLQHIRTSYADEWQALPARWHDLIEAEYEDKMTALRGALV